jgi:hypothetical protein
MRIVDEGQWMRMRPSSNSLSLSSSPAIEINKTQLIHFELFIELLHLAQGGLSWRLPELTILGS